MMRPLHAVLPMLALAVAPAVAAASAAPT
eukprot:COSAG02_NODE_22577_length_747_cov_1.885802_2_plen_28_part_01